MINEFVYSDRDNTIDFILKADKVAQDLSGVTKMELVDDAGSLDTISSVTSSSAFDWSSSTTGKLLLKLGNLDIATGSYIFRLVVYDASNTNGIMWDKFSVTIF